MQQASILRFLIFLACTFSSLTAVIMSFAFSMEAFEAGDGGYKDRAWFGIATFLVWLSYFAVSILWVKNGEVNRYLVSAGLVIAVIALSEWGLIAFVFAWPCIGLMAHICYKTFKSYIFELIDNGRL